MGGYYGILILFGTMHLPLVLTLTIKHNKKTQKVAPMVPKTLQFHEENEEIELGQIDTSLRPNSDQCLEFQPEPRSVQNHSENDITLEEVKTCDKDVKNISDLPECKKDKRMTTFDLLLRPQNRLACPNGDLRRKSLTIPRSITPINHVDKDKSLEEPDETLRRNMRSPDTLSLFLYTEYDAISVSCLN